MPLKIRCPKCRKVLKVSDNARGKAVRCPDCETKIRVPAGSSEGKPAVKSGSRSKRAGSENMGDSTDMLANLDLRKMADSRNRICSKCGTELDPEDTECPECGVDPTTGRIRPETLARLQRKGPDPAKFFEQARGDAWSFMTSHIRFAVRTSIMAVICSLIGFFSYFMAFYSSGIPPKYFWGFIGTAFLVMPPGWAWHLCVNIISLTMAKKSRLKKVNTDIFLNSALGLKHFIWYAAFAGPILLFVGAASYLFYFVGLPSYVAWGLFAASNLIIFPLLPIVMVHMTMPITSPGWKIWKILPVWYRRPFPTVYWCLWSLMAFLPVIALLGSIVIFQYDIGNVAGTLQLNSDIAYVDNYEKAQESEVVPDWFERLEKEKAVPVEYNKLIIPAVLWFSAMAIVGFPAVFTMRMNGLYAFYFKRELELITEEEEYKYVPRVIEDESPGAPIPARKLAVMVLFAAALGLAFGSIYGVSTGTGALFGMANGLSWAGWIISVVTWIWFLTVAFEESAGWGWGCILFCPVGLVFLIMHWDVAKRPFLVSLGGDLISLLAFLMTLSAAFDEVQRGPKIPQGQEVEEGEDEEDDAAFIAPRLNISRLARFDDVEFHLANHI